MFKFFTFVLSLLNGNVRVVADNVDPDRSGNWGSQGAEGGSDRSGNWGVQ